MALKIDEVRKVAQLARLTLNGEEEEAFSRQLGQVVDYFGQLQQFDTAAPEASALLSSREAEDEPVRGLDQAVFLDNAPRARDGFLVVPRVKVVRGEGS